MHLVEERMSHGSLTIASAAAHVGTARYAVDIETGGHRLVGDEPVAAGGADAGASPFGLVLSGLGACTAITLKMYAERKGWMLTGVAVELAYRREGDTAHIDRDVRVEGDLDDAQRARLAEIAEKTPVTLALRAGTEIRTTLHA
jgi:putative redox protein